MRGTVGGSVAAPWGKALASKASARITPTCHSMEIIIRKSKVACKLSSSFRTKQNY